MKHCLVCANPLEAEVDCSRCGTTAQVLAEVELASQRHEFLFGRAKPSEVVAFAKKPEPQVRKAPKAKPVQHVQPRLFDQGSEPESMSEQTDIIVNRDVVMPEVAMQPKPVRKINFKSSLAVVFDVSMCMVLNLIILWLVLWFSGPLPCGHMLGF